MVEGVPFVLQEPAAQIEHSAVAHPGVAVQRNPAQLSQPIQQPIGQRGELVVMEMDLGGVGGESRGQAGTGEPAAATVHHPLVARAVGGTSFTGQQGEQYTQELDQM